jgi:hypothetical protein
MRLQFEAGADSCPLDHPAKPTIMSRVPRSLTKPRVASAFAPQALQRPSLDADPEPGNASLDAYSPKYLSAIWMPSSYIFWYSGWNCSPRFVPRWKKPDNVRNRDTTRPNAMNGT